MNNRFMTMKLQAEILQKLDDCLDEIIRNYTMTYEVVGKEPQQATDWRTGELRWVDDEKTIPYFKDVFGYVPIPETELDEEAKVRVEICKAFSKKLEKLL